MGITEKEEIDELIDDVSSKEVRRDDYRKAHGEMVLTGKTKRIIAGTPQERTGSSSKKWKWGLGPETMANFRKMNNLTEEEAAYFTNVSPVAWRSQETHKSSPTNAFCVELSKLIRLPEEEINKEIESFRKHKIRWEGGRWKWEDYNNG